MASKLKRLGRKGKIALGGLGLVLGAAGWLAAAPLRGYAAAHSDMMRGRHELRTFGLQARWWSSYADLVKDRYGVEHRVVAGCVVTPWLVGYVRGYNHVVRNDAIRRFGREVFEECAREAETAYRKANPE